MHNIITVALTWSEILTILLVVFSPLKVVGPFVTLTREAEPASRKQLASRATLFAAIGVVVAAVLGQRILMSWGIPNNLLLLAGGIIWFVVALLTVLQPYIPTMQGNATLEQLPHIPLALSPLAFPTIITPHGTATLIVLMTTMPTLGQQVLVLGLTGIILLLNWLMMVFAHRILSWLFIPLQLISWVVGVLQVALGLDLIYLALLSLSVFPARP